MYSRLFRRETGNRLRRLGPSVFSVYMAMRMPWLSRYLQPDPRQIERLLVILAESVETGDEALYHRYSSAFLEILLERDVPPIAILVAGDRFDAAVMAVLTEDQRRLVQGVLQRQHALRAVALYQRCIAMPASSIQRSRSR